MQSNFSPSVRMTTANKAGLLFAALIGGWHCIWIALVAAGLAQPILDFVFWAHMIRRIYIVESFDPVAAVTLILLTTITSYVIGYSAGIIWNRLHPPGRGEVELETRL